MPQAIPFSITETANRAFRPPPQTAAPPAFDPAKTEDVVIIGAGYTGLSTALHLAEAARREGRAVNVTVLEAGKVGSGASGKSAGHVSPGFQEHDEAAVLKLFPDRAKGQEILDTVNQGPALVESIIARYGIDCDLRKGYVLIDDKGGRSLAEGADLFGIEPYPYVLGLAQAARSLGVRIYEDTPVKDIIDHGGSIEIRTEKGALSARDVVCAGGHRMAEAIPFLAKLRARTLELLVTTIVTDPLPPAVIRAILPEAEGNRLPFSTEDADVSFGTIDRDGRLIFGTKVGARQTSPEAIARKLFSLFPTLKDSYARETGKALGWRNFVRNEKLNFTAELMPNLGRLGAEGRVRYAHALGGHGIALGTTLGKIIAEEIKGAETHAPALQQGFDTLAAVRHARLPTSQPLRVMTAFMAIEAVKLGEKVQKMKSRLGFGPKS